MSKTTNSGLQTPIIRGMPLSDLQLFGMTAFILRELQAAGDDVRGFLNFSAGDLVLLRGAALTNAVGATFFSQFGIGLSDLTGIDSITLKLGGGGLDLNDDGAIQQISGNVLFQTVDGAGAGSLVTQFFAPPAMEDVLLAADFASPPAVDRLETTFQDFLTPGPAIDYTYIGANVRERINLGLGYSDATGLGGNDVFRVQDDGFGTLSGGGGIDTLDGRSMTGGLFADLGQNRAGSRGGSVRYDLMSFEAIIGTALGDNLTGNDGGNRLSGLNGRDILRGLGGHDTLLGAGGNDSLTGAGGEDQLLGGTGADLIRGGGQDDLLRGDDGNDLLAGDGGRDTLRGGNGDDTLFGGVGGDVKYGRDGNDNVSGNAGDDTLNGHNGNDSLYGGDGRDLLQGGDGQDVMTGGLGKDLLVGGAGNDTMSGGAGRDAFIFVPFEAQGQDRILDFSRAEGDKIRFVGPSLDPDQVTLIYNADTDVSVILFPDGAGGSNEIRVSGIELLETDLQFFGG